MVFSFKHLSLTEKFTPRAMDGQYVVKLTERMKALCSMDGRELRMGGHHSLRCHAIEFSGTTEPEGFSELPGPLKKEGVQPFQFSVSSNEHGRVHGFFIGDIFYVVWIDPHHRLYE